MSRVDLERGDVVGAPIPILSSTDGDSIAAGDGQGLGGACPSQGQVLPIDAEPATPGTPIEPPDGVDEEIVYGEGALWVLGDNGTVTKMDPASGEPGEPIKVGEKLSDEGFFRGEVAFGEGGVWVAGLDDETVVRVDPASGKVVEDDHGSRTASRATWPSATARSGRSTRRASSCASIRHEG